MARRARYSRDFHLVILAEVSVLEFVACRSVPLMYTGVKLKIVLKELVRRACNVTRMMLRHGGLSRQLRIGGGAGCGEVLCFESGKLYL